MRKLGTKTHFVKLTHILPLKKAWGCCYKGLFLLFPSPPSSVDCVELKLECITSTLHRGGRGEGRGLNLTSYCVSVPRGLTRVVENNHKFTGKCLLRATTNQAPCKSLSILLLYRSTPEGVLFPSFIRSLGQILSLNNVREV